MNFASKSVIHENSLVSFTCRKAGTCDILFYFPSEGRHTEDFPDVRKIQRLRPGLNHARRKKINEPYLPPPRNSLYSVWPSHSQWPSEQISFIGKFYSSLAGFLWQSITSPSLSAPLQHWFGSLQFLAFPKAKIAFEMEKIFECDGHTVHKLSQRRLTADWLAPRESDCSRMRSKVSSDWLPGYIKATRPVLEIFKMAGYFPDSPRLCMLSYVHSRKPFSNWLPSPNYTCSGNLTLYCFIFQVTHSCQ